jgi:hypothetical protein
VRHTCVCVCVAACLERSDDEFLEGCVRKNVDCARFCVASRFEAPMEVVESEL